MKSFILGQRGIGEWGVFVAPPGVDAETATHDQLLLHISNFVDQVILRGVAEPPFPQIVSLGLSFIPVVFPATVGADYAGRGGSTRPWYMGWQAGSTNYSSIDVTSLSMTVNCTDSTGKVGYFVFNRAAP